MTLLSLLFCISLAFAGQDLVLPTQEEILALHQIQGKIKGEIIFQSYRTGRWQIMKMNADGTKLKSLTHDKSNNLEPKWINEKIIFSSDRKGYWQIYTMNSDGTDIQNISQSDHSEFARGLSSDGSKLLFQKREFNSMEMFLREYPQRKLYLIQLNDFPETQGHISPILSPDGTKIAFLYKGSRQTRRGIYTSNLVKTGSGYQIQNIKFIHLGCFSVWAKDSFKFMMSFFRNGGTDIHLVDHEGKKLAQFTNKARWNYFPAWGPKEAWIAWAASPTPSHDFTKGTYDIYIQNLKSKRPIRLTFHPSSDIAPSWHWQKTEDGSQKTE